jgi:hypothetical protein
MAAASAPAVHPPENAGYPYGPAAPVVIDETSLQVRDTDTPPLLLAIGLASLFVLADFVIAPLMYAGFRSPSEWLSGITVICLGLIAAQAAVLSAWLVWGQGPFLWRLLIHWGIAGVCCWIWIAGLATVARGTELIDGHCVAALSLAIISAAIQAPLWLARQVFAWRLVRHSVSRPIPAERPSTIGNLMLAISVAAVALAFARLVPTEVDSSDLVAMWSFVAGWSSAIGALGILPMAVFLLRPRSITWGAVWAAGYAILAAAAVLSIIVCVSVMQDLKYPPSDVLIGIAIVLESFFFGLALSAVAARLLGYRLLLGRASRQPINAA